MADIQHVIAALANQYPALNPFSCYCIVTGKPTAKFDSDEVAAILADFDCDPEEAADDYAMRLLASSRPSLRWNKMAVTDIESLRYSHPVETLCYLLNGGSGVRINHPDFFGEMLRRIEQYESLRTASQHVIDYHYFMFYMATEDRLREDQLSARRMRAWLESTDQIGIKAQRAKRIAAIELEAEMIRQGKIKRPARPVSPTTQKKRERDEKLSAANRFFDSFLNALEDPTPTATVATPTPAPRPAGGGFKIRIPGKEA